MALQEVNQRVYTVSTSALHRIRQSLQILLDYAETNHSEVVRLQVHQIEQELAPARVNL